MPGNQRVNVDALFLQQGAPGGRRSLLQAQRGGNGSLAPTAAPAAGPEGETARTGIGGSSGPAMALAAEGPGLVISEEVINDYHIPDEDAAAEAHHDPVRVVPRDIISSCMVRDAVQAAGVGPGSQERVQQVWVYV